MSKLLPYKIARWANHLGFFVMPLLAGVALLLKAVPTGLRIWSGFRLKTMFKRLEAVEKAYAAGLDCTELLSDLDRLDRASATMLVTMSTAQDYVDFRQFLYDMRERIGGGGAKAD